MYETDGGLVVSAGDLTGFLACEHLTRLSREVARGERGRPPAADPMTELVAAHGIAHEERHVQRLRDRGLSVVEIPSPGRAAADLVRAQEQTLAAMRAGADVVYQATFFGTREAGVTWRGHADFLLKRTDRSSDLGPWAYDVADTKLARRVKVPAVLQMALYGRLLTGLQGVPPELLTVVTGDQQELVFPYADAEAYTRAAVAASSTGWPTRGSPRPTRWRTAASARGGPPAPRPGAPPTTSPAWPSCAATTPSRSPTPASPPSPRWPPAPPTSCPHDRAHLPERITRQAALQRAEAGTGVPGYAFLPRVPGSGFELLPPASRGDLFFDIEGDPFTGDHGLEYLWGLLDRDERYTAFWGCTAETEQQGFEQLVDHLTAALAADPDAHVYHYAPYEPARLKALSARFGSRQAEVDRLLRGGALVDLYAVVRQGLQISKESYSIKQLEGFYRGAPARTVPRSPTPAPRSWPSRSGSAPASSGCSTRSATTTATTACPPCSCWAGSRSGAPSWSPPGCRWVARSTPTPTRAPPRSPPTPPGPRWRPGCWPGCPTGPPTAHPTSRRCAAGPAAGLARPRGPVGVVGALPAACPDPGRAGARDRRAGPAGGARRARRRRHPGARRAPLPAPGDQARPGPAGRPGPARGRRPGGPRRGGVGRRRHR